MTTLLTVARSRSRLLVAIALGVAGLAGLTLVLTAGHRASLTNAALLYLVPVVVVAAVGGVRLGLGAALASDLLLNWFFVPPLHTLTVAHHDNVIALLVYVVVAVSVAVAVDLAARQRAAAVRSGLEATLLSRITTTPVVDQSLTVLLHHIRETFGMERVELVEGSDVVAGVGPIGEGAPTLEVAASDGVRLLAYGPELFGEDRRLLTRLATAAARTLETQRLAGEAAHARELAEVDRLRTAILAAVGHDLRTPLSSIKAAASSLRAGDVTFSKEEAGELLATIDESTDRMDDLVENLLAMSRLQAGVLSVQAHPVALDEVVARALLHAPPHARLSIEVGDNLPLVQADPGLLERVVANLVSNAVRAAGSTVVTVRGAADAGWVLLQVIDHGTGIPPAQREQIFAPFQRADDRRADAGLGLGLAIVRGFTEAMGGSVAPSETAGGGATMTVRLPVAAP